MKYDLIVKKLHLFEGKYVTSPIIKEYCEIVGIGYYDAIAYLIRNNHLHTILKGIFYKPDMTERYFDVYSVTHCEALCEALRIKGITNWYYGLETAFSFNNVTHEYYAIDFVMTDTISRSKPSTILGKKVKFVKIKSSLFSFGILEHNGIRYSNIEKTLLDMMYLDSYRGKDIKESFASIRPYIPYVHLPLLKRYATYYNKKISSWIGSL
jgi:hypothetical protein